MYSAIDEQAYPDTMRRWYALESLWRIGARDEAQRLAESFVGCKACLSDSADSEGLAEAKPLVLSSAFVDSDPLAPGGIAIKFECRRDDGRGFLAEFRELLYVPEEQAAAAG